MKNYYRVMLGRGGIYAKEAYEGNFIGVGWLEDVDLGESLFTSRREFNDAFIPIYLAKNPEKTRMSAALACGMLYTFTRGIVIGDIVLCPDGTGHYFVGEVTGDYEYRSSTTLPHRRGVQWLPRAITRNEMSQPLKNSTGAIGTISTVTAHAKEIENLLLDEQTGGVNISDETVEDPNAFALEKHLEDFLVQNWANTELGRLYEIYTEDDQVVGQQYPSDTGPIDILAVSRDQKEILVVELKKGRASDAVVGQILRYMGFVIKKLANKDQKVRGIIIALEDDIKLQRALQATQNIEFYTYKIHFKLEKK